MLEGVLGEAGGPTLEQARLAAQLRQEFKTGSRAPEQIAAPANVTALRGHLTIESGRKPAAPIDDHIPF